jgi:hypothetical protein
LPSTTFLQDLRGADRHCVGEFNDDWDRLMTDSINSASFPSIQQISRTIQAMEKEMTRLLEIGWETPNPTHV